MNTSTHKLCLAVIPALILSACSEVEDQGAVNVIQNLQTTNLDSSRFPWTRGLADGQTKRWDIELDGLIPVKLNGSTLAKQAVDEIEAVLGMSLFDTVSIASTSDDLIERGLVVSEGTAIGPNGVVTQYTCGHVAALPEITDYPQDFYDSHGRINTRLYISLSSSKCAASLDIAIHEFGHALGLGNHFPGFGSGDAISPAFWQVLYTLYTNDAGTLSEGVIIRSLDP